VKKSSKSKKSKKPATKNGVSKSQEALKVAYLHFEKCDLKQSHEMFIKALDFAKEAKDYRAIAEALAGLLRFSGELLDEKKIQYWEEELDRLIKKRPDEVPPMVWYCKGAIAGFREDWKLSQRYIHVYIRKLRQERSRKEKQDHEGKSRAAAGEKTPGQISHAEARGFTVLCNTLLQRQHLGRAQWLVNVVMKEVEPRKLKGINGVLYTVQGVIAERQKRYADALAWFQKAHAAFLEEHNWYHHLYVLYGYARLARHQQNYSQAHWYLDLVDKAVSDPAFGVLRREIERERARLKQDSVDLLVDSQLGVVKTKTGEQISFKKQYVLLDILKELSAAHQENSGQPSSGLSKAELIEKVWKEKYRPEAHDNKLYYNINRLRRLLEPDIRNPKILMNWKEGYRLAPGLKVQWVDSTNAPTKVAKRVSNA
jgi:hypothetical protein